MPFTPSITAKPGFQFVLKIADPAVSPTDFKLVGGLRNTALTINNAPADITNAGSNGFQELLPNGGIQSFNVTADGVFDSDTDGMTLLFTAARLRTLVECQIISGHGDSFVGTFAVANCSRTGPYQDAETFNVTLNSSGTIEYVA